MGSHSSKTPLVVVSGASGSGKTTICRRAAHDLGLYYSVSHTTRPRRAGERDGADYFFVDETAFRRLIAEGEFLEWAQVYGNHYGTSRRIIEEKLSSGTGVILDVDTQGAANIRKIFTEALLIFLKTPDIGDLRERLVRRGRDDGGEIAMRIAHATGENAKMGDYDHVVLNDDLDTAVAEVKRIVSALRDGHH